ncbi:MAG: 3-methyl-2-oxobutanoate hydroxymethyltransferase [Proteobacteria bacterium]|nr:3-methyl-2-oxobutanoate hydroxymethyltransferase [Cystobacterineae bacterium]MCL2314715.1 3-methyl-2-oxobutanoate hydroxymethyltransferase [Pseudomonadota bacterium]
MKKVTIHELQKRKAAGQKICMVTAYDAAFARIFDEAGVDALLVGDSLGMVVQGHTSTLPVTMEHMLYHTQAVSRGAKRAHVVADLPFGSYQASDEEATHNAMRLLSEGGAGSVKLEGGEDYAPTIRRLVRAGIPVMGHIGLMPQQIHSTGGFVVQGRSEEDAQQIVRDAKALEQAGVYALVLEAIPMELARTLSAMLSIPTIGIGAGKHCDGQVLVCYDLLGMLADFKPKFVKQYTHLHTTISQATRQYCEEVRTGHFPSEEHTFRSMRLVSSTEEEPERANSVYGAPI